LKILFAPSFLSSMFIGIRCKIDFVFYMPFNGIASLEM